MVCLVLGQMLMSIFVSSAAISVRYGVDGATIAKIEVGERILGANIVEHRMERVLVIVTAPSIFVYSLPSLDLLDRKQR